MHPDRFATRTTAMHPAGVALTQILAAATHAADPGAQVQRVLQADIQHIVVAGEVLTPQRVLVLAVGKAAPAMATAACAALGHTCIMGWSFTKISTQQNPVTLGCSTSLPVIPSPTNGAKKRVSPRVPSSHRHSQTTSCWCCYRAVGLP